MKLHSHLRPFLTLLLGVTVLPWLPGCSQSDVPARAKDAPPAPTRVSLRQEAGQYQLLVNGQPFYVKGAGLEFGDQEKLAAHGANMFRTWRTDNGRETGQQVLDRAQRNGLYVAMGLEVGRERHGFDYNDAAAVARQLAELRAEVLKYKDHPALLLWIIGNELNLHSTNPKVWDAVNDIAKMIHEVDPNHLTLTALAGLSPELIQAIKTRAPNLDLLGFQMYADIVNLPRYLRESGWDRPYLVTEWGATGHWEVGKTAWGAPIENDSTTKADFYQKRYDTAIRPDQTQCLGSFVFLWGQKQERTPTWYGMFLETGEATATVDVMHRIWNGQWPANRSPQLDGMWLDGKTRYQSVRVTAGKTYPIKIAVTDPNNDPLVIRWEVLEESRDLKDGGDAETRPTSLPGLIAQPHQAETQFTAPTQPGAYRLFGYAFDGKGGAAHANIPFLVEPPSQVATTSAP